MADKRNLTDRTLKALKPADTGGRYEVMDTVVPGFGVRVSDKGQASFILVARYPGSSNPTRRTIGVYGAMTLEAARQTARQWHDMIRRGVDPKVEAEHSRRAEIERQANTFRAVAEDFIKLAAVGPDEASPKQRKGLEVARDIRREFIPAFGDKPIDAVTARDIVRVLDAAVARGATFQAHNLLGHIRRLFNWAISRGVYGLETSPCDRMRPADVIGKKASRTRVLSDREVRAFWRATKRLGYPYGPLFQLLMLTGQRKSEVAEARWSEFDLEKRLWVIPPARMKSATAHVVPLTDDVVASLKALPRFRRGDYLFSTTAGKKAVNGFSKAKDRLDREMLRSLRALARAADEDWKTVRIQPFVIHDIRRTMRTGLSALPIPDLVRELVIAHTKPGLHKVYDLHAYEAEKRHALELWSARLASIVAPRTENVVLFRGRA